jgi:hypothetical protein
VKNIYNTIALCAITFLAACAVAPAPAPVYRANVIYPGAEPAPVVVYSAPPAPQYEVIGTPPVPGYFWISGVWLWDGARYTWRPGYWSAPRPGYVWVPHRWHPSGNQWRMDGGHWLRNH